MAAVMNNKPGGTSPTSHGLAGATTNANAGVLRRFVKLPVGIQRKSDDYAMAAAHKATN